jgi:hypothetical protein
MKAFPVKLPTLWRQIFPSLVAGAVLGNGLRWLRGEPFSLPETLPLMLTAAVVVAATYFFSPTLAGAEGLKVMTAWGFRRPVRWEEIQSVSFARLYFFQPSFKLVTARGRSYWIARDTKDMAGLHALAFARGGPDHPLTRALETPLYAL